MKFAAPLLGLSILLGAAAGRAAPSSRPTPLHIVPDSHSSVTLQGSATTGPWSCRSTKILGQVVLHTDQSALNSVLEALSRLAAESKEPNRVVETTAFERPPSAELSVPVKTLAAKNRAMERDLRRALRQQEFPLITFEYQALEEIRINRDPNTGQLEILLRVHGNLAMAGVRRPLHMNVTIIPRSFRCFHVRAGTSLLMSDFGITPPSALFGLIRAHDKVAVTFDLELVVVPMNTEK